MLEWKWMTARERFEIRKADIKKGFDIWLDQYWSGQCSKEEMLSPNSPLCLPYEDAKEVRAFSESCSDCGKETDVWLETAFSFCGEYGCGMSLCPECVEKLKAQIEINDGDNNDR